MILKIVLMIITVIAVAAVAAIVYGNAQWHDGTSQLRSRLDAAQIKQAPQFLSTIELKGLSARVKRYFEIF